MPVKSIKVADFQDVPLAKSTDKPSEGITMLECDGALYFRLDLSHTRGFSKGGEGNNMGVGSTVGNKAITLDDGSKVTVGLNAWRKPTGEEKLEKMRADLAKAEAEAGE